MFGVDLCFKRIVREKRKNYLHENRVREYWWKFVSELRIFIGERKETSDILSWYQAASISIGKSRSIC